MKKTLAGFAFGVLIAIGLSVAYADQQGWGVPSIISKTVTFREPAAGQVLVDGSTTPSTLSSLTSGKFDVSVTTATATSVAQSINLTSTADVTVGGLVISYTSSGTDTGGNGVNALLLNDVTGGDAGGGYIAISVGTGYTRSFDSANGHIRIDQTTGPTVSSCGTGAAVNADSADGLGNVAIGSTNPTTSCTITFNAAWGTGPKCTLTQAGGAAGGFTLGYLSSTTALTIVSSATMHSTTITWHCFE